MRTSLVMIFLLVMTVLGTGCATMGDFWKRLTGGNEQTPVAVSDDEPSARYSENPQMGVPSNRQYKRMTRARMEEESDLGSQAGSMWVMEGQGAYLFAQNKMRREGDVLNVKLDGPNQKQVETKVTVIKKLLKQLEEQQQAELNNNLAATGGDGRTPASTEPKKEDKPVDPKEELAAIQSIATKIVERMPDGNYRIRGAQPFMIGKREYKVIVAGLVRPEDFNDEGVSSTKLIDPQFDVVSIRRNTKNE